MEPRCLGLSKLNSVLISLLFCTTEGENRAHSGARRMVQLGWPEFIPSQEFCPPGTSNQIVSHSFVPEFCFSL